MKFLADTMLGKLAKWLRVLGYDTHYQNYYTDSMMRRLLTEGPILLSRRKEIIHRYQNTYYIRSDHLGKQLRELQEGLHLRPDRSRWFSRCLTCNVLLREAPMEEVREKVPEYVLYENMPIFRFCPSCERYFWPGSHRVKMKRELEKWGF